MPVRETGRNASFLDPKSILSVLAGRRYFWACADTKLQTTSFRSKAEASDDLGNSGKIWEFPVSPFRAFAEFRHLKMFLDGGFSP